jgi:CelD/BcsL family acetyltransferase involved in cellulose biosynthesis/GNAT superfamily N-acetyltransferase
LTESDYQTIVINGLSALEDALHQPLLQQWEAVLEEDPRATLFQSPVWCMPWYRAYTQFEPRVIVARSGERLVGVVPLAAERGTGRLTFAGDGVADYKDVVTLPQFRERMLETLLRYIRASGAGHTVYFGSTHPDSESPAILAKIAARCGVRTLQKINSGWRWWPAEQTEDPMKKKSVRYPINYFKRQGELCAQHLQTVEEWDAFKEQFFRQHTLRQIYGGRPVAFDSPERRAFFDGLVRTPYAHVTALRLNQELIAGHVGYVYKNVLYWGAPSFDIRYNQYSPNLVLLVLTMQNAEAWGLAGIDLTVGKGDLKERFSTSRADVPYIEIYPRLQSYYARVLRLHASQSLKPRLARWSESAVGKRVRPLLGSLSGRFRPIDAEAVETAVQLVSLAATVDSLQAVEPKLGPGEQWVIHQNEIYDLLQRAVMQDEGAQEITRAARAYTDALKQGKTFYTLLLGDRLAAWGYGSRDKEIVTLDGFYTLPEFRGRRLAGTLATHIARVHFQDGAAQAVALLPKGAESAQKVADRAGFRTR